MTSTPSPAATPTSPTPTCCPTSTWSTPTTSASITSWTPAATMVSCWSAPCRRTPAGWPGTSRALTSPIPHRLGPPEAHLSRRQDQPQLAPDDQPSGPAHHPGDLPRTRLHPLPGSSPLHPLTGPSSSSVVSCGVEVLELDACILGRKPPVDPTTGPVARRLPRRDLPFQGRLVGQPPVQALLGQHGQLDLGHVQPAAVLGGVVQLQPIGQPPGLGRWERRI